MGIFLTVLPLAVGGAAAVLTMDAMAQYSALPQPPFLSWLFKMAYAIVLLRAAASAEGASTGFPFFRYTPPL